MSEKNLLDKVRSGPVTQSLDAVKILLSFVGIASDPMPSDVTLDNGRMVLVLSNKKDCYYVVTQKACSCPAASYHHGPCKHQRKYFPQAETTKPVSTNDSIRPEGKWAGGHNGPVDELKVVA
jgi:hypothetical protein